MKGVYLRRQLHSLLGSQKVGFELDAWGSLPGAVGCAGGLGVQTLLVALDGSFQTGLEVRGGGHEGLEHRRVLRAQTHQVLQRPLMEGTGRSRGGAQGVLIQ